MNMSPMQKLVRLKMIEAKLAVCDRPTGDDPIKHQLRKERELILASVGMPPLSLIGNPDPSAWAQAFVEQFPVGLDVTDVWGWFCNAMMAASVSEEKVADHVRPMREAFDDMRDTLGSLADLLRHHRNLPLAALEDGRTLSLQELIAESLAKAAGK